MNDLDTMGICVVTVARRCGLIFVLILSSSPKGQDGVLLFETRNFFLMLKNYCDIDGEAQGEPCILT